MAGSKVLRLALVGMALVAFLVTGLGRISFNVDVLKLLPSRLGAVTGLSLFARHFSRPTELLITVETAEAETAQAAVAGVAAQLRGQPALVRRVVTESPWETHPQDLSELLAYLLLNRPPAQFAKLCARLTGAQVEATLAETKEILTESFAASEVALASYDPLGLTRTLDLGRFASSANFSEFASADGTFRVLYVEAPHEMGDYRVAMKWMAGIRAAIQQAQLPAEVKVGLTGEPAFVAEISGQMQWDMASSGFGTMIIVSLIFWACFRRLRPLADLIGMIGTTFLLSLATAGWVLGELSVIGVGFASIMIGLSVDYGYMIYQGSLKEGDPWRLRRRVLPFVLWAAVTTSAAFFTLNASSMPGLNQLGNLVAFGVLIGAVVMIFIFLPLVTRLRDRGPEQPALEHWLARPGVRRGGAYVTLGVVVLLLGVLAWRGLPAFDTSTRSLKMRQSEANDALEHLYTRLTDERALVSFVATGRDEAELLANLRAFEPRLKAAEQEGLVKHALSPLPLCPDPAAQRANLATVESILADRSRLTQAVGAAGFHDDALGLTNAIFDQWQAWRQAGSKPIWPANETSTWILRRALGHTAGGLVAMGLLEPMPGAEARLLSLKQENVHLVSWALLAGELRRIIPREFAIIVASLLALLFVLLAAAFRSVRDVGLMAAVMGLVFLCLLGAMRLLGIDWNAFNIASVMLLLGTGTDYSIYIILSLKRHAGDVTATQRSTGLVVFLCAGSAVAGFGALGWAGHLGLASLGQVCALGLAVDALIAVFLLPLAWRWCHRL